MKMGFGNTNSLYPGFYCASNRQTSVLAYFKRNNLFIKSLGATFTAHAVGGMMWIWAFNLPASIWNSLIPVVITERLLFASGIALSFVVVKHTLNFLAAKKLLPQLDTAKV